MKILIRPFLAVIGLLALLGACHSVPDDTPSSDQLAWTATLGADARASDRIVNGDRSTRAQWPYIAALRHETRSGRLQYFCGGTFIARRWVLTAAHCFEGESRQTDGRWEWKPRSRLEIIGGTDDLGAGDETVFEVDAVVIHPGYKPTMEVSPGVWKGSENDLALVRIGRTWTGQLARLSSGGTSDSDGQGARAFVAGFGKQADSGAAARLETFRIGATNPSGQAGSRYLYHAMLPMKPPEVCEKQYADLAYDGSTQICAGRKFGGVDSCQGDSGGPLVALDANERTYQLGIVSYGFECAAAKSEGVYTRISPFRDWIETIARGAMFVDAQPEQVFVATAETMEAMARVLSPTSDRIDLSVVKTGEGGNSALNISITPHIDGRLILFELENSGRINTYFPNDRTPEENAIVKAGQTINLPDVPWMIIPPAEDGARIYAFVIPEGVAFAGDLLPTPVRMRTIADEEQPEREPVDFATRMLTEVANRSSDGGLADWAAATVTY